MISEDRYTQLSMLLSGDLSDEDARTLRAEIEADPDLAAAWQELRQMCADLDAMPGRAPPPDLDDAVIAHLAPRPSPRNWQALIPYASLLVAAAALLWIALPAPPSASVTLQQGDQIVDGHLTLQTAAGQIDLDGRARILWEPNPKALRVSGRISEEDPMFKHLISAGSGALLAIAVYEGQAIIHASEGQTVTVDAGQQQAITLPVEKTPNGPRTRTKVQIRRPDAVVQEQTAIPQDTLRYIEALERDLAALQWERDMQEGALKMHEGTPIAWPESISEVHKEPAVTSFMESLAEQNPDLELAQVDCEEFPCLSILTYHGDEEDWVRDLSAQLEEHWQGDDQEGKTSLSMAVSQSDDSAIAGIWAAPEETGGEEIQTRAGWRTEELMRSTLEEQDVGLEDEDIDVGP